MTAIPMRLRSLVNASAEHETVATAGMFLQFIAACSVAAGVIHLAMVPSHIGEWAPEGVAFAVAGWLQLAVALLTLTRPSRPLIAATVALNAGLIAAWALSRTTGIPVGPHAWHREAVTFIDISAVAIEAAAIAAAFGAIARSAFSDDATRQRYVAAVASIAVLVLATAALSSPSARDHASGTHGMHAAHDDDRGLSLLTNGHHEQIIQQPLDAPAQAALDAQIKVTREVARTYPTVADAEAAGYRRAGPFSPGLGAHYLKYGAAEFNVDGTIDGEDARAPLAIIYDGTDPDSAVAGFMFYSMSDTEPEGFAGPNDVWHYHENICLKSGANGEIEAPFGPDNAATKEQCASVGGNMLEVTQWMVHVWSVPGYDDVEGGYFAEVNPDLDCPDNTYYQLPVDKWASSPLTTCRS